MSFLIGVDSGGTHTNIKIKTPDGTVKALPEISRSLSSNRSDVELSDICGEIFSAIQSATLGQPATVWINAAGYSAASRNRIERLLTAAITGLDIRVGVSNDGVGLVLAHDSELVVVIAGTGSVTMARTPTGQVITRGGDEWVVADYGSAFWLGLEGVRCAYRALEGSLENVSGTTALKSSLIEHFEPRRPPDAKRDERTVVREIARELASLGTDTKPRIASFAPEVTRQAELGDEEAQRIVREAVQDLAGAAARVYRELANQAEGRVVAPRFLLSGSVGYRSRFYAEVFSASLDQFLFDVRTETSHRSIDLDVQLNGLDETLTLARLVSERGSEAIPRLDDLHPSAILISPRYSGTA